MTGITYTQGTTTLGTVTYAYDNAGRRTTVGGTWARSGLPVAAPAAGITLNANTQALTFAGTTMTYDLNGNLATAQSNWQRLPYGTSGLWVTRRGNAVDGCR